MSSSDGTAHLRRVLGQRDLVLLVVVAVLNLNLVPVVAADGPVTLWLWLLALLLFFWPQAIAVIELSYRFPSEGGVYLWTKEMFGDFHGFLSGWCYWTNNVFYIPTLLLYAVGISVYVGGERTQSLGDHRLFVLLFSLGLLWLMVGLHVRGLGVGKWVNNLGGIGTVVIAVALMGLAGYVLHSQGSRLTLASFRLAGADWRLVSSFGVVCFGLVGLELGSVMGDEIRDPRRTLPRAVLWGGLISGALYVGATLALLLALPQQEIGVVQGLLQAVSRMAQDAGVAWLVPPFALLLSVAIAGTTSAWLAGSARIPFVAGIDRYLPPALGRLHPRYASPHVALLVHGGLSCLFLAMSFIGATVKEAYETMLHLAVILQLVPFLYMFAALVRLARQNDATPARYSKRLLFTAGLSGFGVTSLGIGLAFVPPPLIPSVWWFEVKTVLGSVFFLGLAAALFRIYAARKPKQTGPWERAKSALPGEGR